MQVQFNTFQNNYNPKFEAVGKFDQEEIRRGLGIKKWADAVIFSKSDLENISLGVNLDISVPARVDRLDWRSVDFKISEIGGKRCVKESFLPYNWDDGDMHDLKEAFIKRVTAAVNKFKRIANEEKC